HTPRALHPFPTRRSSDLTPARLTNAPGPHGGPVFTADGQGVVYHALRTGHQQIFMQSITGSDAIQLTQEPNTNADPTVSPDGERSEEHTSELQSRFDLVC